MICGRFEQYYSAVVGKNVDHLLSLALTGNDEARSVMARKYFLKTCRKLRKYGCYSEILQFSCMVFTYQEKYSKDRLLEMLKDVSMDRLCALYYANYSYIQNAFKTTYQYEDNLIHFSDINTDVESYLNIPPCSGFENPQITTKLLAAFIPRFIYDIEVNPDDLSEEDIKNLISTITRVEMKKYGETLNEAMRRNRKAEEEEKEALVKGIDLHLGRNIQIVPTELELTKKATGILLDWFHVYHVDRKRELALELLDNHIIDYFDEVLLYDEDVAGVMFNTITDFLRSWIPMETDSIFDTANRIINPLTDKNRIEYILFREFTGLSQRYLGIAEKLTVEYYGLGTKIGNLLLENKEELKKCMRQDYYDFLVFLAIILLQGSKNDALTEQFLVEMYGELSPLNRQRIVIQIILLNHILNSNDFKIVNNLYGYFNYEMDYPKRDLSTNESIFRKMILFLKDARNEIIGRNEYTMDSSRSWFDVLFGNGTIDRFISEQEKLLEENKVEYINEKKLSMLVSAFSYETGIHLGILGLENEDGYDKLPCAISTSLQIRGQKTLERYDKIYSYRSAIILRNVYENTNIVVQRRLYQLQKEAARTSLKQIQTIKEKANEENEQEMLETIDRIVQDLMEQIMLSSGGMSYIENKLDEAQKAFIDKYHLQMSGFALIDKLPLKCKNKVREYLQTAQYVFDLLSTREFSEVIDYSAAIIPLTKTIESILHQVYIQIREEGTSLEKDELDEVFQKAFWKKGQVALKDTLEFGAALFLIREFKFYNIKDGLLKGARPFKSDFFAKHNVNKFLKMERLKSFAGMEIPVLVDEYPSESPNKKAKFIVQFKNDDTYNRMVLYAALDYIRDEFRNKCAHKDPMVKTQAEECRSILIEAQQLLWILMWIYEPTSE